VPKKHISYERREQNDRVVEGMKDMIMNGDVQKRRGLETSAIEQQQKQQLQQEELLEQGRINRHKQKEIATKEFLDL
jgi:hypothetical protein